MKIITPWTFVGHMLMFLSVIFFVFNIFFDKHDIPWPVYILLGLGILGFLLEEGAIIAKYTDKVRELELRVEILEDMLHVERRKKK